jgi:hypothetical protein
MKLEELFIFIYCQLRFGIHGYEGRRKSGGKRVGWERQFVFFAVDINLLGENVSVAKKNMVLKRKETVLMRGHQIATQKRNIKEDQFRPQSFTNIAK